MADQVREFAGRCLPDFVYTTDDPRELRFVHVPLEELLDLENVPPVAGVSFIDHENRKLQYVFTDWSRHQLLAHMGTREKWFRHVTVDQQVHELNQRVHTMHKRRFRTIRSIDHDEVRVVRGLVSDVFADIPDTDIVDALLEAAPSADVLHSASGKTDRAFYIHVMTEEIDLPGARLSGRVGLILKNSEVGYSSLRVSPVLFDERRRLPIVIEKSAVLTRVHRGDTSEMAKAFAKSITDTKDLWGPLKSKINRLQTIRYSDEASALEALRKAVLVGNGSAKLAMMSETRYQKAKHTQHSGATIFEAVLETLAEKTGSKDADYAASALAGVILFVLIPKQ